MKLTKTKEKVSQLVGSGGLFEARIDYKVSSTEAKGEYTGPKFSQVMWNEVLAFFAWTNRKFDSESQVRLFVNVKLGKWAAHAFPQKASTGMTAQELDTDEAKQQRSELFPESEGWVYWGTVHHHCKMSAFQSGVDEANEKSQEGIHITIGNIDKPVHDMHTRVYVSGNCFEPDMSKFWHIGDVGNLVPSDVHDRIARYQMCIAPPKDTALPKIWKKNVIEVKKEVTTYSGAYDCRVGMYDHNTHWSKRSPGCYNKAETAECLLELAEDYEVSEPQLIELLEYLNAPFVAEVVATLSVEKFKAEDIIPEVEKILLTMEAGLTQAEEADLEAELAEHKRDELIAKYGPGAAEQRGNGGLNID